MLFQPIAITVEFAECQAWFRLAGWLIEFMLVDVTWLSRELPPAGRNGPAGVT